ncbi:ComEA family DNA-binding protein [Achromobacter aloeverae]|uniref:DUF655 domain-containing protein n=1 Tax=Achromobacter aloeverae TaxID=1750518 RepID=A0A4Q1HEP0_9BURK|nr:helix-hairpin-helix domain-containing protein [Achromobacter aloeverae]RXN83783.1 DUF655 domain-containing protein [Achromobacter aloeverae]
MNPFLHNPVASAAPAPIPIPIPIQAPMPNAIDTPRQEPAARHWGRRFGALALAAGLSLAAAPVAALDVNTATAEQLQTLRGVGPKTAAVIVRERQRGGNFQSLEDLSDRVRGIGAKKARALQDAGLSIGGGTGSAGAGKPDASSGVNAAGQGKPAGRPGRQGSRRGSDRP